LILLILAPSITEYSLLRMTMIPLREKTRGNFSVLDICVQQQYTRNIMP
jgi:hypothetical protein